MDARSTKAAKLSMSLSHRVATRCEFLARLKRRLTWLRRRNVDRISACQGWNSSPPRRSISRRTASLSHPLSPSAAVGPPPKLPKYQVPAAELLRQVAPRCAGSHQPVHRVEHATMIARRSAATTDQERFEMRPLIVGHRSAIQGCSPAKSCLDSCFKIVHTTCEFASGDNCATKHSAGSHLGRRLLAGRRAERRRHSTTRGVQVSLALGLPAGTRR
jgi:hypothetical protein